MTLQEYIFQLRVNLSHKKSADKVIEILQRKNLNRLGNPLELCLYGHRSLNLIDNRKILLSTIKYIKDSVSHLKHPPHPLPTPLCYNRI